MAGNSSTPSRYSDHSAAACIVTGAEHIMFGHEGDVRRRFTRTLGNLFRLYRPLLDTLHFFDNSSKTPRLIFKEESGRIAISDAALYERLRGTLAP